MRVLPPRRRSDPGFTLMEMLVVMILLGVVAGIGFAGLDRMDPGARGLQVTLESFIESSRERARASGFDVRVELLPGGPEEAPRVVRRVFRPALEAGFEPAFAAAENLRLAGGARVGGPGRSGGGLDLAEGGSAELLGRGGRVETGVGFALEFDLLIPAGDAGRICTWGGLLELEARRDGSLLLRVRAGADEFLAWIEADVPAPLIRQGRWQRLRLAAAGGALRVWVDGEFAAAEALGSQLGAQTSPPVFGAAEDGFHGRVDEVIAWSRVEEGGPELAELIALDFGGAPALVFDRDGRLDPDVHPDAVRLAILEGPDELGVIQVGRFTQEAPR